MLDEHLELFKVKNDLNVIEISLFSSPDANNLKSVEFEIFKQIASSSGWFSVKQKGML